MAKSTLPNQWRMANVVPIFKKGLKSKPNNYRPVSLTSIPCKMIEHIILHQLNMYLDKLICKNQHGFRKKVSCSTQLLNTVHAIVKSVDEGNCIQAVALDFAKAFDKVSHNLLIQKLIKCDIPLQLVRWIKSFLKNRYQKVTVDGYTSELKPVTSGVPQGSVLGPTLFLIYINDIVEVVNSEIRLFADDALLFSTLQDSKSIETFQQDLRSLEIWASKWEMSFNTSKCNLIFFGNTQTIDITSLKYTLGNDVLKIENDIKYLGVTISRSLKWDTHINEIINKAYRILGFLKISLYSAPVKVKLMAYMTLCRPLLEYASDVWDPYTKTVINDIEMIQNKAIRFILNLKGICSITAARAELQIDTLEVRRLKNRTRTFNTIIANRDMHTLLYNDIQFMLHNVDVPACTTRSMSNSVPRSIFTRTNTFYYSFLPRTARDIRLS